MKKKKEFFRIRKDRKRKNGANARACTCVSTITDFLEQIRENGARRFSDKREKKPGRPRKAVDRLQPDRCFVF